jgi:hypothetical protein
LPMKTAKKTVAVLLCAAFIFQQAGLAQTVPPPPASDIFRPARLRFLSFDPSSDTFDMLIDKGSLKNLSSVEFEEAGRQLMDYFLTGVSLSGSAFWVNLRPDAPQSMIDPALERTDIGRIMLSADLQLKKDLARFTSPETPEGKAYWDKLYRRAEELFGSGEITIPTLARPWIVADEIIVAESAVSAYVYKATLKVMLEQDRLNGSAQYEFRDPRLKQLNEYASQLIREAIIPKLNREVNSAKRYAQLRQVYYSLILAHWFKGRFKGAGKGYASRIDTGDLSGLASALPWDKQQYFGEYKKSFSDGEYDKKETVEAAAGTKIRSYFSGGLELDVAEAYAAGTYAGTISAARFAGMPGMARYPLASAISGKDGGSIVAVPLQDFPFASGTAIQETGNVGMETAVSSDSSAGRMIAGKIAEIKARIDAAGLTGSEREEARSVLSFVEACFNNNHISSFQSIVKSPRDYLFAFSTPGRLGLVPARIAITNEFFMSTWGSNDSALYPEDWTLYLPAILFNQGYSAIFGAGQTAAYDDLHAKLFGKQPETREFLRKMLIFGEFKAKLMRTQWDIFAVKNCIKNVYQRSDPVESIRQLTVLIDALKAAEMDYDDLKAAIVRVSFFQNARDVASALVDFVSASLAAGIDSPTVCAIAIAVSLKDSAGSIARKLVDTGAPRALAALQAELAGQKIESRAVIERLALLEDASARAEKLILTGAAVPLGRMNKAIVNSEWDLDKGLNVNRLRVGMVSAVAERDDAGAMAQRLVETGGAAWLLKLYGVLFDVTNFKNYWERVPQRVAVSGRPGETAQELIRLVEAFEGGHWMDYDLVGNLVWAVSFVPDPIALSSSVRLLSPMLINPGIMASEWEHFYKAISNYLERHPSEGEYVRAVSDFLVAEPGSDLLAKKVRFASLLMISDFKRDIFDRITSFVRENLKREEESIFYGNVIELLGNLPEKNEPASLREKGPWERLLVFTRESGVIRKYQLELIGGILAPYLLGSGPKVAIAAGKAIFDELTAPGDAETKDRFLKFMIKKMAGIKEAMRVLEKCGCQEQIVRSFLHNRDVSFLELILEMEENRLLDYKPVFGVVADFLLNDLGDRDYRTIRNILAEAMHIRLLCDMTEFDGLQGQVLVILGDYRDRKVTGAQAEKAMGRILKSAMAKALGKIEGMDAGYKLAGLLEENPGLQVYLLNLASLYLRIAGDHPSTAEAVRTALNKLLELKDVAAFNLWLYTQSPWNAEAYKELVAAGYDPLLWEQGLRLSFPLDEGVNDIAENIRKQTFQLIELAESRGIAVDEKIKAAGLASFDQADSFAEAYLLKSGLLSPEDKQNVGAIVEETRRLERRYKESGEGEVVTVEIGGPRFFADTYAGVGIPGCFNPVTGQHNEMPVMHALEANSMFLRVYDNEGKMVANAIVLLAPLAAVVQGLYSASNLDLERVVFEAQAELLRRKWVPAIAGVGFAAGSRRSAGSRYAQQYADTAGLQWTKKNGLKDSYYFDFGNGKDEKTVFNTEYMFTQAMLEQKGFVPRIFFALTSSQEPLQPGKKLTREQRILATKTLFALRLVKLDLGPIIRDIDKIIFDQGEARLQEDVAGLKLRSAPFSPATDEEKAAVESTLRGLREQWRDGGKLETMLSKAGFNDIVTEFVLRQIYSSKKAVTAAGIAKKLTDTNALPGLALLKKAFWGSDIMGDWDKGEIIGNICLLDDPAKAFTVTAKLLEMFDKEDVWPETPVFKAISSRADAVDIAQKLLDTQAPAQFKLVAGTVAPIDKYLTEDVIVALALQPEAADAAKKLAKFARAVDEWPNWRPSRLIKNIAQQKDVAEVSAACENLVRALKGKADPQRADSLINKISSEKEAVAFARELTALARMFERGVDSAICIDDIMKVLGQPNALDILKDLKKLSAAIRATGAESDGMRGGLSSVFIAIFARPRGITMMRELTLLAMTFNRQFRKARLSTQPIPAIVAAVAVSGRQGRASTMVVNGTAEQFIALNRALIEAGLFPRQIEMILGNISGRGNSAALAAEMAKVADKIGKLGSGLCDRILIRMSSSARIEDMQRLGSQEAKELLEKFTDRLPNMGLDDPDAAEFAGDIIGKADMTDFLRDFPDLMEKIWKETHRPMKELTRFFRLLLASGESMASLGDEKNIYRKLVRFINQSGNDLEENLEFFATIPKGGLSESLEALSDYFASLEISAYLPATYAQFRSLKPEERAAFVRDYKAYRSSFIRGSEPIRGALTNKVLEEASLTMIGSKNLTKEKYNSTLERFSGKSIPAPRFNTPFKLRIASGVLCSRGFLPKKDLSSGRGSPILNRRLPGNRGN